MYGGERGMSEKRGVSEERVMKKKGNGCMLEIKDTKLHFQTELSFFFSLNRSGGPTPINYNINFPENIYVALYFH